MIINVLDGCYIVFDTKNRNIKLYTLLIKYLVSGHCILVCRHIVGRFYLFVKSNGDYSAKLSFSESSRHFACFEDWVCKFIRS